MRKDIVGLILEELELIHSGKSKITIDVIEQEENEDYKEILTSLLYLNEDLEYSNRKKEDVMRQLMEAKEKAEHASKAKADFLSIMSHEMRTPLNAIIGMSYILLDENPRSDQLENLNTLKLAGENLLVLINDILDLNKIEAGKIKFEKIRFNLKQNLEGLIKTLRPKADEKGIRLIFNRSGNLPKTLIGDPTRLTQIVTNLVGNAIKFTDRGYVILDAKTIQKKQNKVVIQFEVEDSGIGIPKDKLELVFESFTQADTNTTRKYGGTGLGLRITKQLIELQDGKIEVRSELGKGSVFQFALAFETPDENETNSNLVHDQDELFSLKNARILIVEDIPVNRTIANKFLTGWGVITDFAENGEIAVQKASENDYDLILMDLQMPVMDGYEATIKIRNLDKYKSNRIPILALTASAMMEIKEKVQEYEMDDFIPKPINPNELNNKVAKYISYKTKLEAPSINEKNDDKANSNRLIIDLKYYEDLANGDLEFLAQISTEIINTLVEFKTNYSDALINNDIEKLRSTVHKAKTTIDKIEGLPVLTNEGKQMVIDQETDVIRKKLHIESVSDIVDVAMQQFREAQKTPS